jgi:hypothetical protein
MARKATTLERPTMEAFHGYLIRWDMFGRVWIEKDNFRISDAQDIAHAKRIIVEDLGA